MINSAQKFTSDILGIDVGSARIGIARIHPIVKLPEPLSPVVVKDGDPFESISRLISEYTADAVVFGLPRSLKGDETSQTQAVREFVDQFITAIHPKVPLYFIDEAGTSKAADARIDGRKNISRDSMSACIMLEDFVDLKDIEPLLIASRTQS